MSRTKIGIWPFGNHVTITSVVGPRQYYIRDVLKHDVHKGWDIFMPVGSQIITPIGGETVSGHDSNLGNYLIVKGADYRINFWHLEKAYYAGAGVKAGVVVALSGNSGFNTTGAHCHMQIAKAGQPSGGFVDPMQVFTRDIIDSLIFPENTVIPCSQCGGKNLSGVRHELGNIEAAIKEIKNFIHL